MIRRALIGLAAAAGLLFVAIPAADASVIGGTGVGGGCAEDQYNVTYGNPQLRMGTSQLPGGPASNIQGQYDFVTYCQPISGTVYLDLQLKTIVNFHVVWQPMDEVTRDLGQTLPRGWQLTNNKVFCSGRHTYRTVLTWDGVGHAGNAGSSPPGGIQYPSGGGQIFNCIKYGG